MPSHPTEVESCVDTSSSISDIELRQSVTFIDSNGSLRQPKSAKQTDLQRSFSLGYTENVFNGKEEQMKKVVKFISDSGWMPEALIPSQVSHFYNALGIDQKYFILESIETISRHIMALYGAQLNAFTNGASELEVQLANETDTGAVYIYSSEPGVSKADGPQAEKRIDAKYLDISDTKRAFRLETYRSSGTVTKTVATKLRCYFVGLCNFVPANPEKKNAIEHISDTHFLEKATKNTLAIYQEVIDQVLTRIGPVINVSDLGHNEKRLVIGYRQKETENFFSSLSDLYHYYRLYSSRKYVEQFSNGITIISIYLHRLDDTPIQPWEHPVYQVMKEASLIYCLPMTPLQPFFQRSQLSIQATTYGFVCWIFAQHFLNRLGSDYNSLASFLDKNDSLQMETLSKIKKRLRQDTFTREYILDIIKAYPDLIEALYVNFALIHYQATTGKSLGPSLSYKRLKPQVVLPDVDLLNMIKRRVSNQHEYMVFESFVTFNRHVLKTNFFHPTKVALSFRLDPSFLPKSEYSTPLLGMFMVVGSEFRGFHLRFADIARGGIRIISSRNREAYSINLRSLFDENYNLALTQERKNKDIAEGGSKGTILVDFGMQYKPHVAFEKFVDSILDLLLAPETNNIVAKTKYAKPEILFFGPDEGTAEYMDWASFHAKKRGAAFWKAFTTGKSQSLGGIPHDTFGMTTRSIRQYVKGIYEKEGINEQQCTKFQTGGPDGDLGSNEIKLSSEKTLAIVDGSGVLYDPNGINRDELLLLAKKRKTIKDFDIAKLGQDGFRVKIEDTNVNVPKLGVIDSGLKFRNEFHLHPLSSSVMFVPCGGRPEAIDINNVGKCFNADNKPKWKYVVEGANLFFTQEARVVLEKGGVKIFKDASANKGGVTSSSLEVLAALSFNDEEFEVHMQVKDGKVPEFYQNYVSTVHSIIEKNARLEFECMWKEHLRTGKPLSLLSDEISTRIIGLNKELQDTSLWSNKEIRRAVLKEAIPDILINQVGLDTIISRIPQVYIRAMFGSYLASRFVYKYGTDPSYYTFFEFMLEFSDNINLNELRSGLTESK